MAIIRDIVSDFSDEDDIELFDDEDDEVELETNEHIHITYATPSSFFRSTNTEAGVDPRHGTRVGNHNDNELCIGMQFQSKEATVNAIKKYHITNSFDYVVVESRPDRYVGRCKHFGAGCEWRIRASFNQKHNSWEIRKIKGVHTCLSTVVTQDHSKLNSSLISDCIAHLVAENPAVPVKTLMSDINNRFGYNVTYRKAWSAREIAVAQIYGDWEASYKLLPIWMNAAQHFAPGTIVRYQASHHFVDNIEDPNNFILDRVFWAFKPSIEGFAYCKPILQVDGTFLTGKYKGTLLIASSQDGNRRVFPVAFAIVEGETKEAWEWFFNHIRTCVTPQANICIISDRGAGLLAAVRSLQASWVNVESVYCIRHIASNFNKEFRNTELKDEVMNMGYELMRPRFEELFAAFRLKNPRAAAWLDRIPKEKWTQAYDEGRRYGHMTTNLAECMNAVLKGTRALPITALVKATYYRLNEWFINHGNECISMIKAGHVYCETLQDEMKKKQNEATAQIVRSFTRETGVSEVEVISSSGGRCTIMYKVNLTTMWCDCGEFQSLRYPCSHAIATCASLKFDLRPYISPVYRLDNILNAYGHEFQPLGNEEYWPVYSGPTFIPNPQMRRTRTGRPKTARIHNEMDEPEPEQVKKCGWCRTVGHTRKTCPWRVTELGQSSGQPSDN